MSKEISWKVIDLNGHSVKTAPAENALIEIRMECTEKGKWVYLDGAFAKASTLTVADLVKANDITVTNALVGG